MNLSTTSPFQYSPVFDEDGRVPGVYDVYDRRTGEYLGPIRRMDDVTPGYWGRWKMRGRSKSPIDGRPVAARGETRDDTVRQALRMRDHEEAQQKAGV